MCNLLRYEIFYLLHYSFVTYAKNNFTEVVTFTITYQDIMGITRKGKFSFLLNIFFIYQILLKIFQRSALSVSKYPNSLNALHGTSPFLFFGLDFV